MVYGGGYPHKNFKLRRRNYKNCRKIRQNFVKRKKNDKKIFLPPHHPPTVKISKITPPPPSNQTLAHLWNVKVGDRNGHGAGLTLDGYFEKFYHRESKPLYCGGMVRVKYFGQFFPF